MEDVFYPESGGDALRAPACGADDNHSATTALLLAAEQLLPLSRAGKLARDVWLVHLTGEEFPADCLGARALAQALVEHRLELTAEDGSSRDVSDVRVVGAYVLDMIGMPTAIVMCSRLLPGRVRRRRDWRGSPTWPTGDGIDWPRS